MTAPRGVAVFDNTDVTIATNVETTSTPAIPFATLRGSKAGSKVSILYIFNITIGAGTTSLTVRIYRSSGTVILVTLTKTVTAGQTQDVSVAVTDNPTLDDPGYHASIVQNAAIANGTVNDNYMKVEPAG